MAQFNYVYRLNPLCQSVQPQLDSNPLGVTLLLQNVSTTVTTDPYPYSITDVYKGILITADTWGDALVSLQVSLDGVSNWTPLLENIGGAPFTNINTDIYYPTVIGTIWVRAVLTCTTGVNITVSIG